MGIGIATLAVGHGLPVLLVDVDDGQAGRRAGPGRAAAAAGPADGRACPATAARASCTTTPEPRDDRRRDRGGRGGHRAARAEGEVLAEVSAVVRPGTPLTSNTSAIPIGELARALARPEELVGAHFMNPPYLIRTVEVIRGPATGDAALKGVLGLLARWTAGRSWSVTGRAS